MPTYEYECTRCGKVTDIYQSITEPPRRKLKKDDPRNCKCDAPVRRRIGTGAGILFKGSGFYKTDYRSESYQSAAKAEKEAGEGKAKSDDGSKSKPPGESSPAPNKSKSKKKKD